MINFGGMSLTAWGVCLFRALDALEPPSRRIVGDDYAIDFVWPLGELPGAGTILGHKFPGAEQRERLRLLALPLRAAIDFARRDLIDYILCRHRLMDDLCRAALEQAGVRQLVILGAGMDTRSLRLPASGWDGRVFELDFPATQAFKRRYLQRAGLRSAQAVYIPCDFNHVAWQSALLHGGYNPGEPSLIVWEGVSMYLSERIFRELPLWLSGLPGQHSLVFDYMLPTDEQYRNPVLHLGINAIEALGETFTYRPHPGEMAAFLDELPGHWFEYNLPQLAGLYRGPNAGPMSDLARIVLYETRDAVIHDAWIAAYGPPPGVDFAPGRRNGLPRSL